MSKNYYEILKNNVDILKFNQRPKSLSRRLKLYFNSDESYKNYTRNHNKDFAKFIRKYCAIHGAVYEYERDFYRMIDLYNKKIKRKNKSRKLIGKEEESLLCDWVGGDFLGG